VARREVNSILSQIRKMAEEAGVSDAELLGRFVATRDEAAFELLVRRHADLVSGVCRRILRDFHDSEDALQATFLALARQARRIRNHESLASWLYRVSFRAALIIRARRIKQAARNRPLMAADQVVARAVPVHGAEHDDSLAALDHEVNRLPERFRAPIVLCYLEGKTVDEAAMLLGSPRGTVASRLARGRKRLHDRLSRRGVELSAGLAGVGPSQVTHDTVSTILAVGRSAAKLHSAEGVISVKVLSLTEEVLRAMFFQRVRTGAITLTVVVGLLLTGGWALHSTAVGRADDPPKPEPNPPTQVATDQPSKEKHDASAQPRFIVTVSHPVKVEEAPVQDFTGVLEPLQTVHVQAQVSGTLEKVRFQPGAEVKKGDPLFDIDTTASQTAVRKALAGVRAASAAKLKYDATLTRVQQQAKASAVSAEEVEQAKAAAASSQAELVVAEVELERAEHDLDATLIRAPISGQIGRSQIDAGNQVFTGKDARELATITTIDPIAVSFYIDEHSYVAYQRQVREKRVKVAGSPLLIKLEEEDGYPHKGMLESFDSHINADGFSTWRNGKIEHRLGSIQARATVPNPDKVLLPGMTVRIQMTTGPARPGLQVPGDSIHFDANGRNPFILVVNQENRVEQRKINFEITASGNTIREGLRPDDWIILSKTDGLKAGDVVVPRRAETPRAFFVAARNFQSKAVSSHRTPNHRPVNSTMRTFRRRASS
jgi:RND family efflux transporter MFP subunit